MNIPSRFALPIRRHGFRFSVAALTAVCLGVSGPALSQTARRGEDLRGVLSRLELRPPLRSAAVSLRYSPDGRYLAVQDPTGIYFLTREPLALRAYVSAEEAYPLEFSSDSATITSVGAGLTMTRAKLPPGEKLEEKDLPIRDGCLQGVLSPGAAFFACLAPDFKLNIYQLAANHLVFSQYVERTNSRYPIVFIPLGQDSAFSGPFGFRLSNTFDGMVNRGARFLSMFFSPDGKTLFAVGALDGFRVDIASGQRSGLPGSLRKHSQALLFHLPEDRVLAVGGEKDAGPAILSLKNGDELVPPAFTADAARLASNSRYALLSDAGAVGQRIFDLQQNRELEAPLNYALDIFGEELAAVDERGDLFLYRLGQHLPFLSVSLPLDHLPRLRAAAVTSSLDKVAFAVDGSGAVFSLSSGQRLYSGSRFSSANFADPSSLYLLAGATRNEPPHVLNLRLPYAKSTTAWFAGKDLLHAGGPVLLEYGFQNPVGYGVPTVFTRGDENDIPYQLRGLDPATGKELWKRELSSGSPVPFADPQGERFVLAWYARSEAAQSEAKRVHPAAQMFKQAKLTKLDTFFEVLDARSGKALSGVLVQQGSGPYSYDAAFSVGDALFLVKDGKRVFVYSLQSGNELVRLVGAMPSASAESGLFAVEEGPGRLSVFDSATAARLDQHLFPDAIAYTHFSADGRRLLALTTHQVSYILDLTAVRNASHAPDAASPN